MNKLFAVLTAGATLCAFGAVLFFYSKPVPAEPTSDPNLTIENRTLVDSRRVSRTESEFTYSADLNNTGPDISGATVTVSSSSPHTTVVDGELEFEAVASGTMATSTDTFSIRQNRRYAFDPEALTYNVVAVISINITFIKPLEWHTNITDNSVLVSNVSVQSPLSQESLQKESYYRIRRENNANPALLSPKDWMTSHFPASTLDEVLNEYPLIIDGREAIAIETIELGGRHLHIYIIDETDVLEVSHGLFEPSFVQEYEAITQSIQFTK